MNIKKCVFQGIGTLLVVLVTLKILSYLGLFSYNDKITILGVVNALFFLGIGIYMFNNYEQCNVKNYKFFIGVFMVYVGVTGFSWLLDNIVGFSLHKLIVGGVMFLIPSYFGLKIMEYKFSKRKSE